MPTVSRFGRAWPTHVNVRGSREHGFLPNVSRFGRAWPTHVNVRGSREHGFLPNVSRFGRAWPTQASCLSLCLHNALRSTLGMGLGALPPPIFKLFFLFLRAWMELSSALLVAFEACSPIVTLGSYLSGDPPGNSSWTFPSLTQTGESYCLNLLVSPQAST